MATRMKLVPENWLNNFKAREDQKGSSSPASNISKKADQLWELIRDAAHVDDQRRIVHTDGSTGSHLADLLQYIILPTSDTRPRPYDSDRFLNLLLENHVPPSMVDGRFGQILDESGINNKFNPIKPSVWQSY